MGALALIAAGDPNEVTSTAFGTHYDVTATRGGSVIVREHGAAAPMLTLAMPGRVVRAAFLLEHETALAAAQADRTMIWDLPGGRLRQTLDARIYAFAHDGHSFVTARAQEIAVDDYPRATPRCRINTGVALGIERLSYSPDDRYLAVLFASGRPADDAHFPGPNPVYRTASASRLYDLSHCAEVAPFTALKPIDLGTFTSDSRHYVLRDALIEVNGSFQRGSWRFDLATGTLTRLTD